MSWGRVLRIGLDAVTGLFVVAAWFAAHLGSVFAPPELHRDEVLRTIPRPSGTDADVDVLYDAFGTPHIYAQGDGDLAYALGYVHARDRLFQIEVTRHAAWGRLTELFGDDLLADDRRLRLVTFGIEKHVQALDDVERTRMTRYVAGLNAGAEDAGTTPEMALLRARGEPFRVEDVVAMIRLQTWLFCTERQDELAREYIRTTLGSHDPRTALYLAPTPSDGVAQVPSPMKEGALAPEEMHPTRDPRAPARFEADGKAHARAVVRALGASTRRGSNAWAIAAKHTASGRPMLFNDPHLDHGEPNPLYLAHLESPALGVVGASVPGVPAIVLGAGRHAAWGLTVSMVDTLDLVEIEPDPAAPDHYWLDGKRVPFGTFEEVFQVGGAPKREVWRSTIYGPMLPEGTYRGGHHYAVMWTGFAEPAWRGLVSGFWDLARAVSLADVNRATESLGLAAQNVVVALDSGHIGYRLAATLPVRSAPSHLPRKGSLSSNAWSEFEAAARSVRIDDPPSGYLLSANHRIVESGHPLFASVGSHADLPYRARRIHERLALLVLRGKVTREEGAAVQLDTVSLEARDVAPALAAHCPSSLGRHCDTVRRFDGTYSAESADAPSFQLLLDGTRQELLRAQFGGAGDVAEWLGERDFVMGAIDRALAAGTSPMFDDPSSLDVLEARAAPRVTRRMGELGDAAHAVRWGDLHRVTLGGPLADIPWLGEQFAIHVPDVGGCDECPMAERGLPVRGGAALRMAAEPGSPPRIGLVLAGGNSGNPASPHFDDQSALWASGRFVDVPMTRADVERSARGRLRLSAR